MTLCHTGNCYRLSHAAIRDGERSGLLSNCCCTSSTVRAGTNQRVRGAFVVTPSQLEKQQKVAKKDEKKRNSINEKNQQLLFCVSTVRDKYDKPFIRTLDIDIFLFLGVRLLIPLMVELLRTDTQAERNQRRYQQHPGKNKSVTRTHLPHRAACL